MRNLITAVKLFFKRKARNKKIDQPGVSGTTFTLKLEKEWFNKQILQDVCDELNQLDDVDRAFYDPYQHNN